MTSGCRSISRQSSQPVPRSIRGSREKFCRSLSVCITLIDPERKHHMKRLVIPALLSTMLFAASAQAHHIWLQQDAKSANMYFGEFAENLREVSPGRLDKFQPNAVLLGSNGDKTLDSKMVKNAIVLSARAGKNESIIVEETRYPLLERKTGDTVVRTAWTPAARLVTSDAAQAPRLTLDVVPTGKPGEFKLFYKGQPLPKTKINIQMPAGWTKESHTDEQGVVKFDLPWQGTYVVEAHHTDKTAGERDGKPYDIASFVTSLTLTQTKGIKAVPAAAVTEPSPVK